MPVEKDVPILDQVGECLRSAAAHRRRTGRPFVTLSYAQSLDGSIADRPGRPLALSGPQAMALTHGLQGRARGHPGGHRHGAGRQSPPQRQAGGRPRPPTRRGGQPPPFSPVCQPLEESAVPPGLPPTKAPTPNGSRPWKRRGPGSCVLPGSNGWVDLADLLKHLGSMGINSLMVEGGAQIITSFLASRLVDQVVLTIAPLLVGGLRVVNHLGRSSQRRFPRLKNLSYQQLGDDLVLRGEPDWDS